MKAFNDFLKTVFENPYVFIVLGVYMLFRAYMGVRLGTVRLRFGRPVTRASAFFWPLILLQNIFGVSFLLYGFKLLS
jgi:hypothetical protein